MRARTLGERLVALRLGAGFETQRALARAAGVAQSTIADLESGRVGSPSSRTRERLADALKINAAWLADDGQVQCGEGVDEAERLVEIEVGGQDRGLAALAEVHAGSRIFEVRTEAYGSIRIPKGCHLIVSTQGKVFSGNHIVVEGLGDGERFLDLRIWGSRSAPMSVEDATRSSIEAEATVVPAGVSHGGVRSINMVGIVEVIYTSRHASRNLTSRRLYEKGKLLGSKF